MRSLPNYVYTAIDRNGKRIKGKMDAPNKDSVVSVLKTKGIYLVKLDEEGIFNLEVDIKGKNTLSGKKVAIFSRQFSMLLKAGISISGALEILKEQLEDKQTQKITEGVHQDVLRGVVLSEALKNSERFPDLFINTIAAGEIGGFLDEVMERMALYYEKETKLASKVKNSLIYPTMVLLVTLGVVYVLVTKVVPQFAEMFVSMDLDLPFLTRMLMGLGNFMTSYWIFVFLGIIAVVGGTILYVRTPNGKFQWDSLFLAIPLVRSIVLKSVIARFSRTISIMLKTGVPMINAIEYSSRVLDNTVVEKAMKIVKEEVSTGSSLAAPIEHMKIFPKMVISMIKIGEETGALDEMMNKCAEFYDDEVEVLAVRITSLIEPLIILILAGVVGTIVMAIILPMFQMYSSL